MTGASDGFVRVFSAAEERWASPEQLKEYDERIAGSSLPTQQVGDVKKSDLPGEDALLHPGKLADVDGPMGRFVLMRLQARRLVK